MVKGNVFGLVLLVLINSSLALGNTVSIRKYATCSTTEDQSANVAKAFDAAKNNAFVLSVDCAMLLNIGTNVTKPLFIGNDTTVTFTTEGKFLVNNVGLPAFVIANSSNITLTGWNIEYTGMMPASASPSSGGDFSGTTLEAWYKNNRGTSGGTPVWPGVTNEMGVFFIMGESSNIQVTGLDLYSTNTNPAYFVPVGVSFVLGFRNNVKIPHTSNGGFPKDAYGNPLWEPSMVAIPNDITFKNIRLDGTLMGFVGNAQNATFENVTSGRYSDLQTPSGTDVGGYNNWFAPPHLFYFKYDPGLNSALANKNLTFSSVNDLGERVGSKSRNTGSGDNCSLKFNSIGATVSNYTSKRPDGFMDFISSSNVTLSNITVTYNSSSLPETKGNTAYPAIRYLAAEGGLPISFSNVVFNKMTITDEASETGVTPISSINYVPNHTGITYNTVSSHITRWNTSKTCNTYANNANVDYYSANPNVMQTINASTKECTVKSE